MATENNPAEAVVVFLQLQRKSFSLRAPDPRLCARGFFFSIFCTIKGIAESANPAAAPLLLYMNSEDEEFLLLLSRSSGSCVSVCVCVRVCV